MARKYLQIKGLDAYSLMLSRLEAGVNDIAAKAVYEAGAIVADTTRQEIAALPTVTRESRKQQTAGKLDGITADEKADLSGGFGITPMENKDGTINIKTGFDGYGSKPTKKYPKGVPNVLLARAVAKGTSFRLKNDFNKRSIQKSRPAAQKRMAEVVSAEIAKRMKG